MSFSRALAPLRRGQFLRPRNNNPWNVFERDPFFASLAPLFNNELAQFQRYNFPRVDIKEGPKSYRIEAEIPGFRKDDVSIEFLDSRTLRISGKRHVNRQTETEPADEAADTSSTIETKQTPEAAEQTNASENAVSEEGLKEVQSVESEEGYEMMETEREQEVTFTRQWRFPEGVDQDAVKASLEHGILSVILPKMKAEAARRVTIE